MTGSGVVYARRSGQQDLTFDFAEGLIQDNLLLVDRETDSVWSQLDGKAIAGPMKDSPLKVLPSIQTTWIHWRGMYPDTRVMVIPGENGRPYIYRSWVPGTPRPEDRATSHDTSVLGLGFATESEAIFFPFRELANLKPAALPLEIVLDSQTIKVHYRAAAPTAWAEDSEGRLLNGVLAYEWGWKRFHPASTIFSSN